MFFGFPRQADSWGGSGEVALFGDFSVPGISKAGVIDALLSYLHMDQVFTNFIHLFKKKRACYLFVADSRLLFRDCDFHQTSIADRDYGSVSIHPGVRFLLIYGNPIPI